MDDLSPSYKGVFFVVIFTDDLFTAYKMLDATNYCDKFKLLVLKVLAVSLAGGMLVDEVAVGWYSQMKHITIPDVGDKLVKIIIEEIVKKEPHASFLLPFVKWHCSTEISIPYMT